MRTKWRTWKTRALHKVSWDSQTTRRWLFHKSECLAEHNTDFSRNLSTSHFAGLTPTGLRCEVKSFISGAHSEINPVIQHSPSSSSSSSLNQSLCCCPRWSGWWHCWRSRHCRTSAACGFGGLWPGRLRSLETQDPRRQELLTLPLPLPQDLHPNSHTQGLVAISH